MLRKVPAGFDDFVTEKYQDHVAAVLHEWSSELLQNSQSTAAIEKIVATDFSGQSLKPGGGKPVNEGASLQVWNGEFTSEGMLRRDDFFAAWRSSVSAFSKITTAQFQVISIRTTPETVFESGQSRVLETVVRFELVGTGQDFYRQQRVGNWQICWTLSASNELGLRSWTILDETRSRSTAPVFVDVAQHAFGGNQAYAGQFLHGTDYWRRCSMAPAASIFTVTTEFPSPTWMVMALTIFMFASLPGFPIVSFVIAAMAHLKTLPSSAGVGVLENTACALFADIENTGRQDLIVVRASGPLLFRNHGRRKIPLASRMRFTLQLRHKELLPARPLLIMTATAGWTFIFASTLITRALTNIATRCRTTTQRMVRPIS